MRKGKAASFNVDAEPEVAGVSSAETGEVTREQYERAMENLISETVVRLDRKRCRLGDLAKVRQALRQANLPSHAQDVTEQMEELGESILDESNVLTSFRYRLQESRKGRVIQ